MSVKEESAVSVAERIKNKFDSEKYNCVCGHDKHKHTMLGCPTKCTNPNCKCTGFKERK